MASAFRSQVEDLMERNKRTAGRYTYTVPSEDRYPFQWLWDSCFHAVILSHYDMERARDEIRSVIARPFPSGLLPHIIYWDDDYHTKKWGREEQGDILSGAWGTHGVSAITQPPLLASTILRLHHREHDLEFLHETYPATRAYYEHLLSERRSPASGLLGIVNPDESGEDNSPRFDAAQRLLPKHSADESLDRRIELVLENRKCNYDIQNCMRNVFWIEDITFNSVFIPALHALSEIASIIGVSEDAEHFLHEFKRAKQTTAETLCDGFRCYSVRGEAQEKIRVDTWALFLPLYAELLSEAEAKDLVEEELLNKNTFWTEFPVPSVSLDEPAFSRDDLWRGPTWTAANWFIVKGLRNYGFDALAAELAEKTRTLVERSGFREFYDPITGEGLGAHNFTWGGLVLDMET